MIATDTGTRDMVKASKKKFGAVDPQKNYFTPEVFERMAADLKSGRIPLKRQTISDPVQVGLRVIIRNTGEITYHVQYRVAADEGEPMDRPYLKLGNHPDMKLSEARQLAKVVINLADRGINVQDGLHERLVRELQERGEKWRP